MVNNSMNDLRAQAGTRGITVPFGINKAGLQALLEGPQEQEPHPSDVNPRAARETGRDGAGRAERVPLGTPNAKMSARKRPGYARRWINDTGDRVVRAEQGGYQFVEDEKMRDESGRGKRVSMTVGTKQDGTPLWAYLMEIREEFHEEDQRAKQSAINETEAAINRGEPTGVAEERDKFYRPSTAGEIHTNARS